DVFREVEVTGDSSRGDSGQSGSDKCDMGDDSDEKDGGNILSSEEQCEKDEFYDADDLLSPVAKLEKYADNEITFNRQVVTKNILDTLRTVVGNNEEVTIVLNILQRLSEDQEPTVRTEVMEQVPHIAVFCSEFSSQFGYVIPKVLVPMVIRYFSDENDQVRKTSQAALLVLFEQGLMDRGNNFCMKAVVEEQVCPVILRLTEPDSFDDNYRTEAVALMSKLAPFIGMDLTLRFFLDKFSALCSDSLFHVRKVCAANFGDMCSVVGTETTESVLLPKFYYLCEDSVWDVRKACSEVFMAVSCACSLDTRKNDLAPLFINLLCDPSRWVKMSAFQTLGPFISTFADPHTTGLYYDGVSSICNPNKNTYNFEKTEEAAVACSNKDSDGSAEDANVTNNSQDNDDGSQPNCSTTKSVD
ncbi:PPP4R1 (predicted), partial [Pycnogonum litorale]